MSGSLAASIIIPAFGRPEKLRKAVLSAIAQDLDPAMFEVIVVDSSANDENVRLIDDLQREAKCSLRCFHKVPEGPGPSRNLGARESSGSVFAFLDSDCQATPGWLRNGVALFEDSAVGIVQGRTLPEPGVPHGALHEFIWVEKESFLYQTANIFYRREAFEEAGGFASDPQGHTARPLGGEDADLAWDVKRRGWQSRFATEAVAYHEVIRLTLWHWLADKRLYVFPRLVRDHPELRQFFYARWFYDRTHASLLLAALGVVAAPLHPATLLLALPYIAIRASEPTGTFRGPLRIVRAAIYLPKDIASFLVLMAGSIHFRSVLL